MVAARIIPTTLMRKIKRELLIRLQLKLAMPMPAIDSGGIRVTAIATPDKVSFIEGMSRANVPPRPAIRAMTDVIKVGFMLFKMVL